MKAKINIIKGECDYLDEEMPEEIDFSNGIKNPYAKKGSRLFAIEPEVLKFFPDSNSVNEALRNIIKMMNIMKKQTKMP